MQSDIDHERIMTFVRFLGKQMANVDAAVAAGIGYQGSLSEQGAPVVLFIPKAYPHGCVVAHALDPSCLTIDAAAMQALPQSGTQRMVETQTAVAFPIASACNPRKVYIGCLKWSARIGSVQALRENALIRSAALGL